MGTRTRPVRISFRELSTPHPWPGSLRQNIATCSPCVRPSCECYRGGDDRVMVVMVVVVVLWGGLLLPTTQHSTTLFHLM